MSEYTYTDVEVNTSEGIQNYGVVLPGQSTVYKRFDKAYRQAQLELFIENGVKDPMSVIGEVMGSTLGVIEELTKLGMSHNDIKPSNLLLMEEGIAPYKIRTSHA